MAYDPSLGKTSEDFRFIFFLREAQENPKSPRTSTPGERKALRRKAWSEVTFGFYSVKRV